MKKILFLMAILPIIVFTACSSDDEEEIINISFSETEISIPVGDEYDLKINGIDISECNIYSQDEFIAYAMSHGGKINISADHTGETKVIAEYKNKKIECNVTVTSLVNYIGNPILKFGLSKNEVKNEIKGNIINETENKIEIKEDFKYPIYDTYHFNNGKLECVYSEVNINTNTVDILNSLLERYKHVSSESNVHWFSYPNKFIIRENARGGNGGYAIRYAKDKETMEKYYQL
ncbi:hypothetical protein [Phocaeicola vulgatus]|uniref:hypothetical protein n=1 Tax=Phocaeicola vulgatus TaxID=821 RepID=UPI0032C0BFAA